MTSIAVVGTENYFSHYDSANPETRMNDLETWCENTWEEYVDDSGNNYDALFVDFSESEVEIPESALPGCNVSTGSCATLSERRTEAEDWLQANWSYYTSYDSIAVLDWYGGDQGTLGYAPIGGAYEYGRKTTITDMHFDDADEYGSYHSHLGAEGTALHEVLHNYCALHDNSEIIGPVVTSDCDTTVMYSITEEVYCDSYCSGDIGVRVREIDNCAVNVVRCFVDAEGDGCHLC